MKLTLAAIKVNDKDLYRVSFSLPNQLREAQEQFMCFRTLSEGNTCLTFHILICLMIRIIDLHMQK